MPEKTFKAPCPTCRGICNTLVHGEIQKEWSNAVDSFNLSYGQDSHKLLECCGCGTVFYYKDSWGSEHGDNDIYGKFTPTHFIETVPAPEHPKLKPDWLLEIHKKDQILFFILDEVYTAYEHGSFILASTGLRTAFDHSCAHIGIPNAYSMEQKVKDVFVKGYVSETERDQLRIVIEAGNAAAHRGWRPDKSAFESLLHVAEKFIQQVILRDLEIERIGEKIPKKQKKKDTPPYT